MNKPIYRYKSLPVDKAPNGHKYRKGKWYKEDKIDICNKGFHCSKNLVDAMGYVSAGWIARVEVRGRSEIQSDKEVWSEIKIVDWKKWTKRDSVALAIYSAELVLDNFEREYPDDKRPRKAIEATKKVLKSDTAKNRSAARSAESAAWSAARSAESAAWSAVGSARSAARSAGSAAWSVALEKTKQQIHDWIIELKKLAPKQRISR